MPAANWEYIFISVGKNMVQCLAIHLYQSQSLSIWQGQPASWPGEKWIKSQVSPPHETRASCVCGSLSVVSDSLLPDNYSLPGSSVHGILQTRILERVAVSFSSGSSWPSDWIQISYIVGRFFTIWARATIWESSV